MCLLACRCTFQSSTLLELRTRIPLLVFLVITSDKFCSFGTQQPRLLQFTYLQLSIYMKEYNYYFPIREAVLRARFPLITQATVNSHNSPFIPVSSESYVQPENNICSVEAFRAVYNLTACFEMNKQTFNVFTSRPSKMVIDMILCVASMNYWECS